MKKKVLFVLLVSGLLLFSVGTRLLLVRHQANTPTIKDVLVKDEVRQSADFPGLVASLLAFSFTALSLAKGYEIFKRTKSGRNELLLEDKEDSHKDKLEDEVSELKHSYDRLLIDNVELKDRLKKLGADLIELNQVEQILRKSNICLSKECERLKNENEELSLKFNSMQMKSKKNKVVSKKAKTKAVAKKIKTTSKVKVKKTKIKNKVKRKSK